MDINQQSHDAGVENALPAGQRFQVRKRRARTVRIRALQDPLRKMQATMEGKMAARWKTGIFVGYSRDSYEHVVWDTEERSLVMIRSLKRVPPSERYKPVEIEQINEKPTDKLHRSTWKASGQKERVSRLGKPIEDCEDSIKPKIAGVRDLKVTQKAREIWIHRCGVQEV